MIITRLEFMDMEYRYHELMFQLPPELREVLPTFNNFLSPANLSNWHFGYYDTEKLSVTGAKRWQMLLSPHASTLLRAWALQRLPANAR